MIAAQRGPVSSRKGNGPRRLQIPGGPFPIGGTPPSERVSDQCPKCSRMVRVTSVGVPAVLNSRPFTETVLPTVNELRPDKSKRCILESVMTLMVAKIILSG